MSSLRVRICVDCTGSITTTTCTLGSFITTVIHDFRAIVVSVYHTREYMLLTFENRPGMHYPCSLSNTFYKKSLSNTFYFQKTKKSLSSVCKPCLLYINIESRFDLLLSQAGHLLHWSFFSAIGFYYHVVYHVHTRADMHHFIHIRSVFVNMKVYVVLLLCDQSWRQKLMQARHRPLCTVHSVHSFVLLISCMCRGTRGSPKHAGVVFVPPLSLGLYTSAYYWLLMTC